MVLVDDAVSEEAVTTMVMIGDANGVVLHILYIILCLMLIFYYLFIFCLIPSFSLYSQVHDRDPIRLMLEVCYTRGNDCFRAE